MAGKTKDELLYDHNHDAKGRRKRDVSHRGVHGISATAARQSGLPRADEGSCGTIEERARDYRRELR